MRLPLLPAFFVGLLTLTAALAAPATPPVRALLQPLEVPAARGRSVTAYAGQPAPLKLSLRNTSRLPVTLGGFQNGRVACPALKVYARATGRPVPVHSIQDCDVGTAVTLRPGQHAVFDLSLPMPLPPGDYTAVLSLAGPDFTLHPRAALRIGPGPLVPELRVPPTIRAGQPLKVQVALHNVWATPHQEDVRLCGAGLIIRAATGTTVYDNQREKTACAEVLVPTTFAPFGTHVQAWSFPRTLKLAPGQYSVLLWGRWNDSLTFHVLP